MPACNEVTVEQAEELLQGQSILVLDRRDSQSYQQGHIDGAMMAHDGLVEAIVNKREFDRPLLVYCYHGNDSRELAGMFASLGFKEVYSMIGGFAEWKRSHV